MKMTKRTTFVRNLFLTLVLLTSSGCSWWTQTDDVDPSPKEETTLNIDNPSSPDLKDVEWVVVTEDNAEEVFERLKEDGKDPVIIGLSDDDYSDLAINMEKIQNFIASIMDVNRALRKFYEGENKEDGGAQDAQ